MVLATDPKLLKIGELSRQSQVPIKTIRYYEELGLLQSKGRTSGGFRLFTSDILTRLAFIKRSQNLGLSLQEIHHILKIHDQGQKPCYEVKQTLQEKVCEVEERIQQLSLLRQQLLQLIEGADGLAQMDAPICPIIESTNNQV